MTGPPRSIACGGWVTLGGGATKSGRTDWAGQAGAAVLVAAAQARQRSAVDGVMDQPCSRRSGRGLRASWPCGGKRAGGGGIRPDGGCIVHVRTSRMAPPIKTVPHRPYVADAAPEVAARRFFEVMTRRRTVRHFSGRGVSRETIEWCVRAAGSAPSGANKQPWRFVCVNDPALKAEIRRGAEAEEIEFYSRRATPEWLADLAPLGTDACKEFLEVAPWLIVVFKLAKGDGGDQVYYVNESVGIAVGMLLCALHHAGLATLTHTPSPMGFLGRILGRPEHERPYLLIPVGYPADGCSVPDIQRKGLEEVMVINRGV